MLALPILALAPTLVGTLVLVREQRAARTDRVAIRETTDGIDRVRQELVDAETGARGYAASGDDVLLEPYSSALQDLPDAIEVVIDGDEVTYLESVRLRTAIDEALEANVALVAKVQAGVPGNQLTLALREGKELMDAARDGLSAVHARLLDRFAASQRTADRLERTTTGLLIGGLLLGSILALAGSRLFTRSVARRLQLVTDNAVRLGDDEPLVSADDARDEIGRLSRSLEQAARLLEERSAQLLHSRNRALAATRAKDEFLSRMSHELRTPLTAVIGFGQLLQMEELSDLNRDSVDHIVRAGRHLLDLINEVLDIARIETGDLSLSVEPLEVQEVVEETLSLMGPYAAEHQVTIVCRGSDAAVEALADRQRLKQVLLNLFSNAIKYNRVGGTVTVDWSGHGGRVHISVRDTGLGISEEGRSRIFVPFDRVDATHSTIEGTGVGLSLSKGLMEAMDGAIAFESTLGTGSTFWLDLPRAVVMAPEPAMVPDLEPLVLDEVSGREGTVLYVEDNLANVRVMERLFSRRRETLSVAMQGSRCLDLARQLAPSLILLDLHLPDLDGEEVLRRLKTDPATSDVPVVILSADTSPRRMARLRDLGAAEQLAKPLDLGRLVEVLDARGAPS